MKQNPDALLLQEFKNKTKKTNQELAEMLGYNSGHAVSDIITGQKNMSGPAKKNLENLVKLLKVNGSVE